MADIVPREWPRICTHPQCRGTATPATHVARQPTFGDVYYCEKHVMANYRQTKKATLQFKPL